MSAPEFRFSMTVSGGPSDVQHGNSLVTGVARSVLGQMGLTGDAVERLVDELLAARNAAPAGACTLQFAAHAGTIEIVLSQAGRDWHTSCPVP